MLLGVERLIDMSHGKVHFIFILLIALIAACSKDYKPPDLGNLYTEAAKQSHLYANPVIVIPGILGSKLIDSNTGRIVWGAFVKDYANPEKADGARLIAFPMEKGVPLSDLKDGVVSDGALDKVKVSFFGIPVELNAYIRILLTLGAGGYYDESLYKDAQDYEIDYGKDHFTCFQFDYDWRRDNVETARLLHEFILEKKEYVERKRKELYGIEKEVKFDIVAHSMGGLVARYYLRYGARDLPEKGPIPEPTWDGAEYVDRLILIGTPNAGSANVIYDLVEGKKIGPFLPKYEAVIIGSFPSSYQLIPRDRHHAILNANRETIDMLDYSTWIQNEWGLADPKQDKVLQMLLPEAKDSEERKEIARDHLKKVLNRANRFHEAIDYRSSPPDYLKIYLIAGDAVPTKSVLIYNEDQGKFVLDRNSPGDGTVTRSSALMDERLGGSWEPRLVSPIKWTNVTFIFNDHLGLTKDPTFTDNLLFLLLEQPE